MERYDAVRKEPNSFWDQAGESDLPFRQLIDHSPDMNVIACGAEWLYINEAGSRLLHTEDSFQLAGKTTYDFFPLGEHERIEKRLEHLYHHNPRSVQAFEAKMVCCDGNSIDVEVVEIPFVWYGTPYHFMLVKDMTEQKYTRHMVEYSGKLNTVGQLAAGIAHEVRNPLTVLKGFLQLLQSGTVNKQHYYDIMLGELQRMEQIVTELLLLGKPQDNFFQLRDLVAIVNQVYLLFDSQARLNNIEMTAIYKVEHLNVYCDENQIKQVFINIAKNAMESMAKGGELIIEVTEQERFAMVRFTDQGIGIPKDMLDNLGKPFFTTKEQGTGLGLMVCRQIIKHHAGSLSIASEVNVGTTFEIMLPKA